MHKLRMISYVPDNIPLSLQNYLSGIRIYKFDWKSNVQVGADSVWPGWPAAVAAEVSEHGPRVRQPQLQGGLLRSQVHNQNSNKKKSKLFSAAFWILI
jgi:hypothetical protein